MNSTKLVQVTENNFYNLPSNMVNFNPADIGITVSQQHYGLYLNYSTGYWIEGNYFFMPSTVNDRGVVVKSSGEDYNHIYRNTFEDMSYGVRSLDDNRGLSESDGLKVECNTLTDSRYDIAVNWTGTGIVPPGLGISQYQGFPDDLGQAGFSAGNQFITDDLANFYDVLNQLDWVNYYSSSTENLVIYSGIVPLSQTNQNVCDTHIDDPKEVKKSSSVQLENESQSQIAILSDVVDGGNTEELTDEVINTTYSEALELYYNLMSKSPDLSDEVMKEAIQKEYELPVVLLTNILASNPSAAKSGEVQKELDDRLIPLEQYQRDMIDQGLALISYKEELESIISYKKAKSQQLLNEVIQLTYAEEFPDWSYLESELLDSDNLESKYLLVDYYRSFGEISNAENILIDIPNCIDLDERQNQEYSNIITLYEILEETSDLVLSSENELELLTLAETEFGKTAGIARAILEENSYSFKEEMVDELDEQRMFFVLDAFEPHSGQIEVYPNPANSFVQIKFSEGVVVNEIRLTDLSGRIVKSLVVLANSQQEFIDLTEISSGIYNLIFISKEGVLDSKLLEIMK